VYDKDDVPENNDWFAISYLDSGGNRRWWSSPVTLGQVELYRTIALADIAIERLDKPEKRQPKIFSIKTVVLSEVSDDK